MQSCVKHNELGRRHKPSQQTIQTPKLFGKTWRYSTCTHQEIPHNHIRCHTQLVSNTQYMYSAHAHIGTKRIVSKIKMGEYLSVVTHVFGCRLLHEDIDKEWTPCYVYRSVPLVHHFENTPSTSFPPKFLHRVV